MAREAEVDLAWRPNEGSTKEEKGSGDVKLRKEMSPVLLELDSSQSSWRSATSGAVELISTETRNRYFDLDQHWTSDDYMRLQNRSFLPLCFPVRHDNAFDSDRWPFATKPPSFTLPHDHDLLIILSPAGRAAGQSFYLNVVSPISMSVWAQPGIGDPTLPPPFAIFGKSGQDNGAVGGSRRWEAGLVIDVWAFDGREVEYSLTSMDGEDNSVRTRIGWNCRPAVVLGFLGFHVFNTNFLPTDNVASSIWDGASSHACGSISSAFTCPHTPPTLNVPFFPRPAWQSRKDPPTAFWQHIRGGPSTPIDSFKTVRPITLTPLPTGEVDILHPSEKSPPTRPPHTPNAVSPPAKTTFDLGLNWGFGRRPVTRQDLCPRPPVLLGAARRHDYLQTLAIQKARVLPVCSQHNDFYPLYPSPSSSLMSVEPETTPSYFTLLHDIELLVVPSAASCTSIDAFNFNVV
ncbi:hypothetical protein GALMADRAFT_147627 [Galerina marginata CBS 339.88]|uniref:Uncharacterized protein n=1 Tax=Galerina marginata (strain CBS 339.88) TaxID=685588 RepID=A0A067S9Y1_GALM3|nr:hypothetical protein GALMADRAFT_147627 [Galerina marginata CBS 339.88]